jgi:hypothetical protein
MGAHNAMIPREAMAQRGIKRDIPFEAENFRLRMVAKNNPMAASDWTQELEMHFVRKVSVSRKGLVFNSININRMGMPATRTQSEAVEGRSSRRLRMKASMQKTKKGTKGW